MEESKSSLTLNPIELKKYHNEILTSKNVIVQELAKPDFYGKDQIAKFIYCIDNHLILAEPQAIDLGATIGAVLRKPNIELLCKRPKLPLIEPLAPSCLKAAASYELRLGSRYRVRVNGNDKIDYLNSSKPVLTIPPHGIAMVSTYEWLNIPGFLIARWNLKVKKVYDGLVWVGSLQVDPGYQGFLFCPIYNLSDQSQDLVFGTPMFTIDFVLTTPSPDKYELWSLPEDNKFSTFDFERLDIKRIHSAPESDFEKIRKDISDYKTEINESIEKNQKGIQKYQDWVFVSIAVIVAVLAIISTFGLSTMNWSYINGKGTTLVILSLVFSILAVLVSFLRTRKHK